MRCVPDTGADMAGDLVVGMLYNLLLPLLLLAGELVSGYHIHMPCCCAARDDISGVFSHHRSGREKLN